MQNAWNVFWLSEDGARKYKKFEGDSPRGSGAIDFAKKLRSFGRTNIEIVSRRKAFAPPPKQSKAPEAGMVWCPYCLKWRHFVNTSIRHNGIKGPQLFRCPICTISIKDYYVRLYNFVMVEMLDAKAHEKKMPITNPTMKRRRR